MTEKERQALLDDFQSRLQLTGSWLELLSLARGIQGKEQSVANIMKEISIDGVEPLALLSLFSQPVFLSACTVVFPFFNTQTHQLVVFSVP